MKTFNELVTEEKVDNINKEPYRLVVLTEKPKKEKPVKKEAPKKEYLKKYIQRIVKFQ